MQISEYYRKIAFHGRGKVARAFDHILFLGFVMLAFRLLARGHSHALLLSIALTLLAAIAYVILLRMYVVRCVKREKHRIGRELIEAKLLLMDAAEAEQRLGKAHRIVQCARAELDDVLPLLRSDARELWLCGTTADGVMDFVQTHTPHIRIHTAEELQEALSLTVTEEERTSAIRKKERKRTMRKSFGVLAAQVRPERFLLLGTVLLLLSFFAPFPIYIRLLSSASFLIGSLRLLSARRNGSFMR